MGPVGAISLLFVLHVAGDGHRAARAPAGGRAGPPPDPHCPQPPVSRLQRRPGVQKNTTTPETLRAAVFGYTRLSGDGRRSLAECTN